MPDPYSGEPSESEQLSGCLVGSALGALLIFAIGFLLNALFGG
jgi:hypothetical protein